MLMFKREVSQPLAATAQQARKIYTSAALQYDVSVLFKIGYTFFILKLLNQLCYHVWV